MLCTDIKFHTDKSLQVIFLLALHTRIMVLFVVYVCIGVQQSAETPVSDRPTTTEQQKEDDDHDDDLIWRHSDTLLLIETFRKFRPKLQDRTKKKKEIWEMVASAMNDVQNSNKFTGARCNKKWNNLELRYKSKRDKTKKTGRGGGKQWPYFELIDEIVGSAASSASVTEVCAAKADRPLIAPESSDDDDTQESNKSLTESNKPDTSIRKRKRDQPPRWFAEFTKSWEEEGKRKHEELKEMLQRQEQAIRERTAVMSEMKDIVKLWLENKTAADNPNN